MEKQHQLELCRQVDIGKKAISDLQTEIGVLKMHHRESVTRIRELEASVVRLHEDAEAARQSARSLQDKVAERDGLLQIARMSLESSEKQNQKQTSQVSAMQNCSYSTSLPLPVPPFAVLRFYTVFVSSLCS